MKISVIIPAFNEEQYIEATIKAILQLGLAMEIIVVDDGSSDDTYILAKGAGIRAVKNLRNQGKGRSLGLGLKYAQGDIIAFLDADIGEKAAEIKKLLLPVMKGDADMAVAVFPPPTRKGGFGFVKTLAKSGVYLMTGKKVDWALSGQRVMRRKVLQEIGPISEGFGVEVGLTIDVLRMGFKVEEVAVDMTHRETGRDLLGIVHRTKQFINILIALIHKAVDLRGSIP